MGRLRIVQEDASCIADYARVPIAFTVTHRIDLDADPAALRAVAVERTFVKDYDGIPGNHPTEWIKNFAAEKWWIIGAFIGDTRVGGAAAFSREDLTILWDIRVHPDHRSEGVGRALFEWIENTSRSHGPTILQAETQDINLAACRFYKRMGCELAGIDRAAYADFPEEVQLTWQKRL